ncbi:hypothetical protein FDA94_14385 [Herbidospora galbida]|uniref:Uncharacterized protein n=1 Tax=Herbidospora galbida TaxID=2575442 RepID=A0A4U3MH23_9ACTN|nr:hypothetical protein [Herbidospora galbida]TKK88110.1 hypothetical protein FDA94_14385 [Herbidospora galbida]
MARASLDLTGAMITTSDLPGEERRLGFVQAGRSNRGMTINRSVRRRPAFRRASRRVAALSVAVAALTGLATGPAAGAIGPAGTVAAPVVHRTLPFPTDPGGFLALALKIVFGPKIQLDLTTPGAVVQLEGQDGTVTAAGKGTLTVELLEGRTKQGKNVVQPVVGMLMAVKAFSLDFPGAATGDLSIRLDPTRSGPPSGMSVLDPGRSIVRFAELFFNPLKWPGLTAAFLRDPKAFFKSYLGIFFPAQHDLNVNVKATSSKFPGVTLVNKDTISLQNATTREFPPRNGTYAPLKPIELVDIAKPNGPVLVRVDELHGVLSYGSVTVPSASIAVPK